MDHDAVAALAWIERGMPDSKVGYGPDAPRLKPAQLEQFRSASYVRRPKAGIPRQKKAKD
jgi:hypothetical protein